MRHWNIIAVVCFAVMAVAFCCLVLYPEGGEGDRAEPEISGEDPEAEKPARETGVQEDLSARLAGFARIIYEYDTLERKFYVGAQDYMTEDAFGSFAPLAGEGGDDGPEDVRVRSCLLETKSYYCFLDESHAEAVMESRFTLSAGGNGSLIQYLKLSVEKENGVWLITDCHVIDTLEQ